MKLAFASRGDALYLLVVADDEQVTHDGRMYQISAIWDVEDMKSWLLDLMCITGLEEIRLEGRAASLRWASECLPDAEGQLAVRCGSALDPGGGRTLAFCSDRLAWSHGLASFLLPLGYRQAATLAREVVLGLGFTMMQVRRRGEDLVLAGRVSPSLALHGPLPLPLRVNFESPRFWWQLLKAACSRQSFWTRAVRGDPVA